ncbi:MAG: hypothetical protein K8F91_21645, partial [Candidatus Obscuribacterales bacterium]|nr:hypothetical protein [Candidatus Obscuribacterales bacterium]
MTRIAPIIVLICAISGVFFGFVFFDHSHDKPTNPPEGSAQKQKSKKQDRLKSAPEVDFGPYMA